MRFEVGLLTVLIVITIMPTVAGAWGMDGHRTVAAVAARRLNSAAKIGVAFLLGDESMERVASWADTVARTTHPQTERWHYVNTPYEATGYNPARDCISTARGDCVIAAIPRLEKILLDRTASHQVRREALMFLIHFVGDLHNPLHAIQKDDTDNDTGPGGIGTQVELAGNMVSLHAAWDSGIIRAVVKTEANLLEGAEEWLNKHNEKTVMGSGPRGWGAESFRLGKTLAYPQAEDGEISEEEQRVAMGVIAERIALAGVRLAEVLNQVFAKPRGHK